MARVALLFLLCGAAAKAQEIDAGKKQFETRCAGCHGADGGGGEHGPNIVDPRQRGGGGGRPQPNLRDVIQNGIPEGGMPAFRLPQQDLDELVAFIEALRAPAIDRPARGDFGAGARFFWGKGGCAGCHMVKGKGGVLGPELSNLGRQRRLVQIELAVRNPGALAMPGYRLVSVRLRDGRTIRGLAKNQSNYDLQLQGLDGTLHMFSKDQIAGQTRESKSLMPPVQATEEEMRDLLAFLSRLASGGPVSISPPGAPQPGAGISFSRVADPKPGDWPTYHGLLSGNRHSALREINIENVSTLGAKWIFPIANARRLEVTPVVVDGVMYVTTANEVYALDARSGRQIWHYAQPLTKGVIGDAASAINRGVAVLGDKVFMVTDHAHVIALHRSSGQMLWDSEMADYRQHYGATSAPLVVKGLVVTGTSGGDEGARGFVDAFQANTGERAWRFWTMPAPGEPGSETWVGRAIEHGCSAPWLTGTYDAGTDLIYWPTGNPCPDYNGDERKGDNLYSNSVVALEPKTGKLRWYYQFTPHDLHDWDATETPMLVDAAFRGRPRKLLLQATGYALDSGSPKG